MRVQTFYDWLQREVRSSRMALVKLYESRDHLLYVEAPPLRKKYMEIFGSVEESVLEQELEVTLLEKKAEMIQTAVNRREKIDLAEIEKKMEAEKAARVSAVESADKTLNELPVLSEQDQHTLQRQYREITSNFHPAMNPDITDVQKELYQKAVEAYKMQDVEAMKLIYESLFSPGEGMGISFEKSTEESTPEERRAEYREYVQTLSTDYFLAKELYQHFVPLEEDQVVLDTLEKYNWKRKKVEEEIRNIREGFPFNAVSTMNDKTKTQDYLAELRVRANRCAEEKEELEKRISKLLEGRINV